MFIIPIEGKKFEVSASNFGYTEKPRGKEGILLRTIISAALYMKQQIRKTSAYSFPKVTFEVQKSTPRLEIDSGVCSFGCTYCQMKHHPEYTPLKFNFDSFRKAVLYIKSIGGEYSVSIARKEISDFPEFQENLCSVFEELSPTSIRYFTNGSGFPYHKQPVLDYIVKGKIPYQIFFASLVSEKSKLIQRGHYNFVSSSDEIIKSVSKIEEMGASACIVLLVNPFDLPKASDIIEQILKFKSLFSSIRFSFDILSFLGSSYKKEVQRLSSWYTEIIDSDVSGLFDDTYGQFGSLRSYFWPQSFLPKSINSGSYRVLLGEKTMSIEHHPEEQIDFVRLVNYKPEDYIPCRVCHNFEAMPHGCIERVRNNTCFWFYPRCENCLASLQCNARRESALLTEEDCIGCQTSLEFWFRLGMKVCRNNPYEVLEVLSNGNRDYLPGKSRGLYQGISG